MTCTRRVLVLSSLLLLACGETAPPPTTVAEAPSTPPPPPMGAIRFAHLPEGMHLVVDGTDRGVLQPAVEASVEAGHHAIEIVYPFDAGVPGDLAGLGAIGQPQPPIVSWQTEVDVVADQTLDLAPENPPPGWPRLVSLRLSSVTPGHVLDDQGHDLGATPLVDVETWSPTLTLHPDDGAPDEAIGEPTSDWWRVRTGEPPPEANPHPEIIVDYGREFMAGPLQAAGPQVGRCMPEGWTGRVDVSFQVAAPSGQMRSVSIHTETPIDAAAADCALGVLMSLRWSESSPWAPFGGHFPYQVE